MTHVGQSKPLYQHYQYHEVLLRDEGGLVLLLLGVGFLNIAWGSVFGVLGVLEEVEESVNDRLLVNLSVETEAGQKKVELYEKYVRG